MAYIVIQNMQDFSSIHLACHASQGGADPLKSRFLFHRGSLELGTIHYPQIKSHERRPRILVSVPNEHRRREDLRRYRSPRSGNARTVGVWQLCGHAEQEVAPDLYSFIFAHMGSDSGTAFDGRLSAHALHHATRKLRQFLDDYERSLLTWIPFFHFGY
ncbi:hypothetical protein DFP72DRAFT_1172871 [Ephemerocybe angulata]|uniref:Uncharacterized protein n=1 Tax=Ephemerocybe angulata TaxID=980116 RepID=A0A8H6HQM6_9AGAR|nr:hypothetical protein DFP72DRAFT_1172871 [Tulosesus angulatus]